MPTWKPAAEEDDDTIGFMGGVLNRARKVLFADDMGEINNNNITKQQQQQPTDGKKKSRARSRARLLASSNSSLVNITSSKSNNNAKEKKGVVKPRIDKENNKNKSMLPSKNNKSFTKRYTNLTMDSLASSTAAAFPNNQQSMSLSIGNKGLIAVNHRRNSREQLSNGGSLAANSSMNSNQNKKQQPRQLAKVKRESNQRLEKLESSDKDELNVTTYSLADIDNSFTTTTSTKGMIDIHKRKNNNRRKGGSRCNHPVSSMVQESSVDKKEATKSSKGKPTSTGGISSLMALPASTQKTQKSSSSGRVATKKAGQTKKKKQEKLTKTSLLNDVSSLTNCVESLMIEEEKQPNQQQQNSKCSTPLTIRHRSMSGGITSPPINHRYTSISTNNSSLFPDRTPRPEINPNMKKKCDSKPTPDNFKDAALSTAKPMVVASPAPTLSTTEMAISPIVSGGNEEETAFQAADTSFTSTVASPRILTTTPSFISSPTNEGDGSAVLCDAKSNLFSNVSKAQGIKTRAKKSGVTTEQTANSPVRGSCVMEVELPTARKEGKAVVSRSRNMKKINLRTVVNKKENKPIAESGKAKELVIQPLVTTKEEEIAEPTRRSTRQSKPTDRLTVASWKNKKKKKNGERIVTFDSVERADESIDEDDGNDEEQVESPNLETIKVVKEQKVKTTKFKTENNSIPKQAKQAKAPLNPTTGDGEWTNDEISMLRDAQKNVNPTSTLYWQEVAVQVGTKSSSECQSKWQAMVATPKIVRRATKKKDTHTLNTSVSYDDENDNDDNDDEEDDLFNSSPYRQAEVEEDDIFASKAFSTSFGSTTGLSPCIKEGTTSIHQGEKPSALKFRRKGYNTYIDNLRKDINRVEKKKKKNKSHKANKTSIALNDTVHNDIRVGENNMSGNLLPDGTVKINIQEEEEQDVIDDDIWGNDQEEEDEEDDIFS